MAVVCTNSIAPSLGTRIATSDGSSTSLYDLGGGRWWDRIIGQCVGFGAMMGLFMRFLSPDLDPTRQKVGVGLLPVCSLSATGVGGVEGCSFYRKALTKREAFRTQV